MNGFGKRHGRIGKLPAHRPGQVLQGVNGRQYRLAEKPVILKDGIVGDRQRMTAWSGYRGNVFHRWRVWSSMPTGTPLVLVAQWRVVPLQISAPVS